MISLKFEAEAIEFDLNSLTKRQTERLNAHARQAARVFLRAIISAGVVPIDTGMAMGSFLNLGRFLRVAVLEGPGPHNGQRTYTHSDGTKYVDQKGPELGARFATQPQDAFISTDDRVEFQFQTDVYHYYLNEFGLSFSSPWNSFEVGREAALAYSRANFLKDMPRLLNFIVKTEIGGSV